MLMWGLALRHGWGVEKSEEKGFKWLKKAAECAVGDLESARKGGEKGGFGSLGEKGEKGKGGLGDVKDELVLAIYEVGQSFYRGWGVEKDKKMGVVSLFPPSPYYMRIYSALRCILSRVTSE